MADWKSFLDEPEQSTSKWESFLDAPIQDSDTSIVKEHLGYTFEYDAVSEPYRGFIEASEAKHRLPRNLLANLIKTESDFDPKAIGPMTRHGQAMGIGQIMTKFHPDVDPTDPEASIDYSAGYLKKMYDRFGTWDKSIAAYNKGPSRLDMEKLPEETRNYLDKINAAKVTELETPAVDLPTKLPSVKEPTYPIFNIPLSEGIKYGLAKNLSEAGLAGLYGEGVRGGGVTGEWGPEYGIYEEPKPNLIKRGLSKLAEVIGSDIEPRLSEAARAQAVVQLMASEEKVPLHEYRQSPELIEKAASSFVSMSSFGLFPALKESLTGEVDFESTNVAGYAGYGLGSAAGFFFGPIVAAKGVLSPAVKYLPRATQEGKVAARVLKEAIHDGILISVASGLAQMGEAAKSVTFSQVANQIWEGAKSGAVTGVVFGASRGLFPAEGVDKAARIVTGLIGLNAQRAIEVGGDPFTNRPIGEVVFDTLLDVLFLWNGLPKADFNHIAKSVDDLSKQAVDIDAAEKVSVNVQDEVMKQALDKVLEAKRKQFELASEEFVKNLGGDVATAEDIMWQSERLAKEKVYPIERTGLKKATKAQVRAITGRLPDGVDPEFTFISKKGNEYVKVGKEWYDSKRAPVTNTFIKKAAEKGKVKVEAPQPEPVELVPKAAYPFAGPEPIRVESAEKARAVMRMLRETKKEPVDSGAYIPKVDLESISTEDKINALEKHYKKPINDISEGEIERFIYMILGEPEPIADVDVQTGSREIGDTSGENSTFFTNEKLTEQRKVRWSDPYQIKSLADSPEKQVQKLLNDANRWYKGDDSINIENVRNEMTRLHTDADEFLNKVDSNSDPYFMDPINHLYWKEHVGKAAEWVRNLVRLKIKPTEGPKLYTMIPLDEVPKAVKDLWKAVKKSKIPLSKLFRNKKVFNKTGYWLGQDGKWRYELDDTQLKVFPKRLHELGSGTKIQLGNLIEYPDLFKKFPEMKSIYVSIDKSLPKNSGYFNPVYNNIVVGPDSKSILLHELQHWVNNRVGTFPGINIEYERKKLVSKIVEKLRKVSTDPKMIKEISSNLEKVRKHRDYTISEALIDIENKSYMINKNEYLKIKDITSEYFRFSVRANYLKDPGEMESRLVEARMKMSAKERKAVPPWETLEQMTEMEGLGRKPGLKLYSGLPIDEIKKLYKTLKATVSKSGIGKLTPEQQAFYKAGEWNESFEEARNAKRFNLKRFLDRAGLHTGRAIHERKMRLRSQLIKEYGADGHRMLQYIDAGDAADGRADRMFYEMRREAYKNVPSKLTVQVDAVDLKNRLKDIYGYKTAKEFNPPKGMGPEQTAAIDALLDVYKGMTPKERSLAEKASKIMSDHVRIWIDDMVRVGLKSEEEGKLLKSHNYRKMRSLRVENLYDQKYKIRVGDKLVRQSDSGVDPLGKNAITMVETDSKILYKETADRIYRRVSNQETKLKWKEFDAEYGNNPFVMFKDNDKTLGRPERKVPKGWVMDFWYDNGERKTMYYHPDVALQLLSSGPHMSFPLTRILTTALGINLTRSLTVGTSALWATTRGITMDLGHTFFSARSFDAKTGKLKRTYSKLAPVYLGQIGRDMISTFHDVMVRGEKTGVYEKNGGSMPFLAMRETHFTGRGVKPPGTYSKLLDGLSFWSQSMERWNRVAVMERSLRQQAKKAGITLEEAYKNRDMTMEAVNVAVERLPYRQGGWLVKEIDKIFGPFISASYNAGRTFGRGAKENPVDFAARIANIAVPTVGMTVAMTMYASEAKRDTPEWQHISGPVFTLFPDTLNFIDEEGNKRWINLRLPTDPMIAMVYNIFRGLTNKMMYESGMTDVEPNYGAIVDSIVRSLPADTPLSPTLSAWFTYFRNIDVWRGQKVVEEPFDWPRSGEEGQRDPKLGQLAKDIGKATGLSPKRLKAAGRQVGFQSNEITWAMGKLYDMVTSDIDPRLKKQHWAMIISQTPGLKNLMSVTVPRAYRGADRKEMKQAEAFDSMIRRETFNEMAEGYYWKGVGSEADIDKFIDGFEEKHIRESLERKRVFVEKVKYLPHRSSWSNYLHTTPEYKAEDFYKIWEVENSPDERLALERELDELLESGYIGKGSEDRFFETLENFKYR